MVMGFIAVRKFHTLVNKSRTYFWFMDAGRIIKFGSARPARIICERFLKALDKPLSKGYLKDYEKLFKVL